MKQPAGEQADHDQDQDPAVPHRRRNHRQRQQAQPDPDCNGQRDVAEAVAARDDQCDQQDEPDRGALGRAGPRKPGQPCDYDSEPPSGPPTSRRRRSRPATSTTCGVAGRDPPSSQGPPESRRRSPPAPALNAPSTPKPGGSSQVGQHPAHGCHPDFIAPAAAGESPDQSAALARWVLRWRSGGSRRRRQGSTRAGPGPGLRRSGPDRQCCSRRLTRDNAAARPGGPGQGQPPPDLEPIR